MPRAFRWMLLAGLALCPLSARAVSAISVEIGQLESAQGELRELKLDYDLNRSRFTLQGQYQTPAAPQWQPVELHCGELANPAPGTWQCADGALTTPQLKLPFSLKLNAGGSRTAPRYDLALALRQAAFSDESGLHAGEKIDASLAAVASKTADGWLWQAELGWTAGEAFWQPFYLTGDGHRLTARGSWHAQGLEIDRATLSLHDVGSVTLDATLAGPDYRVKTLHAASDELDLAQLYPVLLKPLLEQTALRDLEIAGRVALRATLRDGALQAARLDLRQMDVADRAGRFTLYKVDASLPWDYDQPQPLTLAFAGGQLLKLPLGAAAIQAELNRYALTAPVIRLPMLDGALSLQDVSAAWLGGAWHWHLRADVQPISMSELSHALGWPLMEGKVAAAIPLVTYSGGTLTSSGDMRLDLFDGRITVSNLTMQTPLGSLPRLGADLTMRQLDLGALTHTFSFGAIEGRLDGDVRALELLNWKPVHFDAAFYSSPGNYKKKISQRAVENISALGGAGAAAAIQRSVLRFFDSFGYGRLGLSCKLRNDRCEMDGVESTAQGYVIVKGSGVPAITVLGYNRNVSWSELLERLQRVTAGNSKPIIQGAAD